MQIKNLISATLVYSMLILNIVAPFAQAQSVFDVNPPEITLDELSSGIAGETQIFTAQVTDDISIQDVKIYYRYSGQLAFKSLPMEALGNSSYYSARLETDPSETRSIEYYLQARDNGGNRVVRGFAFEPLVRALSPAGEAPIQQAPIQTGPAASSGSGGFKWWYVALGVLAVGAAAGLAGGGGSSDGGGQDLVPFNVSVSTPQ